jgi:hypothetical protein
MSKILLLNGPRNCGKSEATRLLKQSFTLSERPCKAKLYTLTMELFNLAPDVFWDIYNTRSLKEVPLPEFTVSAAAYASLSKVIPLPSAHGDPMQLSCRQAMIFVSEVVCKPTFGQDYFGVARANAMVDGELAIDDSCGFDEEIPAVIERLGEDNVLLVRIHGRGEFSGDSRAYIHDGTVPNTLDVYNTGSEREYLDQMYDIARLFYGAENLNVNRKVSPVDNFKAQQLQDELDGWLLNKGDRDFDPETMVRVRRVNGTYDQGEAAKFNWLSFGEAESIYKYLVVG